VGAGSEGVGRAGGLSVDSPQKNAFLKDEYLHLQKVIEDFDGRAVTIKAWSISFSMVGIGGALAAHAPLTLLVASLSAALFWLIEGFWKTFQDAYFERAYRIEEFFAGDGKDLVPLQISRSWHSRWKRSGTRRLWRIMSWPHVALPHAAVLLVGLVLYGLHIFGIATL
jgi:hypothetical protein